MNKKHKNTEDCETTQEFPEWGLYTNFTDIPRRPSACYSKRTKEEKVFNIIWFYFQEIKTSFLSEQLAKMCFRSHLKAILMNKTIL